MISWKASRDSCLQITLDDPLRALELEIRTTRQTVGCSEKHINLFTHKVRGRIL
jgi:hypothetical protein